MIDLDDYADAIALDERPVIEADPDWRESLRQLLDEIAPGAISTSAPPEQLWRATCGMLAPVEPNALPDSIVDRLEGIARAITLERGVLDIGDLPTIDVVFGTDMAHGDRIVLDIGDITRRRVDAIVNAANRQMLGCRQPNHPCIDNAIHSAAGPRLRSDCEIVMRLQGEPEAVGSAKLTRGHALVAPYVIHTVGPQLEPGADPTPDDIGGLADCYRSILDLAAARDDIRSVAICAISTGVFAFPRPVAAGIAVAEIQAGLERHPDTIDRVVINCFTNDDADPYLAIFHDASPEGAS